MTTFSRRSFLRLGGLAAAGAASATALAACAPSGREEPLAATNAPSDGLPYFFANRPDPIEDITSVQDFDVVVVGAGAAGVPAALSAFEAGASVALIQKEDKVISQGNSGTGVLFDESDKAGVEALVSFLVEDCAHKADRAQFSHWAEHSGEALQWLWARGEAAGCQMVDTSKQNKSIENMGGYHVSYFRMQFGPKPYNNGDGMRDLAAYAEQQGVNIFYSTPAEQLVRDENGAVTGVIASSPEGYIQLNATKGVIMATGDYMNNDEMMNYYVPESRYIWRKQSNKTGDGHKMMIWAGAHMEDNAATKTVHDFDGGPAAMGDLPCLCVRNDGTRFCNEDRVGMAYMSNYLKSEKDSGWYTQVFDSTYETAYKEADPERFGRPFPDPAAMETYMPDVEGAKEGVYESLINTFRADTLEELAQKLGLEDSAQFVKTVERYNSLCAAGSDEDFGKPKELMIPVSEPPFYGIHRHVGVSCINHGVDVDGATLAVLGDDGEPIKGLYAIGSCAGNCFGSPDYPLGVGGITLGRCWTQGYAVGKAVASL